MGFYLELISKDQEESFPFFVKQLLIAFECFTCSNDKHFYVLGVYPGSSLNYLQYSTKVFVVN